MYRTKAITPAPFGRVTESLPVGTCPVSHLHKYMQLIIVCMYVYMHVCMNVCMHDHSNELPSYRLPSFHAPIVLGLLH